MRQFMEMGVIISLIISGLCLLWTVYRDKSGDTSEILERVSQVETKVLLAESTIERLEAEQDEMKKMLRGLETQINQLNVKVERILAILESNKGA